MKSPLERGRLVRLWGRRRAIALKAKSLRANDPTVRTLEIQGRKIVVSIDGGRFRIPANVALGNNCAKSQVFYGKIVTKRM